MAAPYRNVKEDFLHKNVSGDQYPGNEKAEPYGAKETQRFFCESRIEVKGHDINHSLEIFRQVGYAGPSPSFLIMLTFDLFGFVTLLGRYDGQVTVHVAVKLNFIQGLSTKNFHCTVQVVQIRFDDSPNRGIIYCGPKLFVSGIHSGYSPRINNIRISVKGIKQPSK